MVAVFRFRLFRLHELTRITKLIDHQATLFLNGFSMNWPMGYGDKMELGAIIHVSAWASPSKVNSENAVCPANA